MTVKATNLRKRHINYLKKRVRCYKLQTTFKTSVNRSADILHKGISDHINISTMDC